MTVVISRSDRRLVLALLCVASFAVVFNNLIITPILPEISDDLEVRVAIAGLLVTAYAIVGGVAAVFSGPIIDRIGRRPVVVAGMSTLTVATAFSALAPNFGLLMAARAQAGLGVACLTPAVFAAVGDYFSYEERGRAMSWVITANTSASIFGVPAGALISGLVSWRWTFIALAVVLLFFAGLIWRKLPGDVPREASDGHSGMRSVTHVLRDLPTTMTLTSNFLATGYWFVFITYMGAYFHDEFGMAKWALGSLTMVMGMGVLVGGNIGGRLADRSGKRPILLWTSAICALFIALQTTAAVTLWLGALVLFLFATSGGARFAAAQAIVSEMAPNQRGTVMALNAAGQQFGIVVGSALGGLVLGAFGYTGLGPAAAVLAVGSLVTYALFVNEARFAPAEPAHELRTAASG